VPRSSDAGAARPVGGVPMAVTSGQ
jgi:hypothetical protein